MLLKDTNTVFIVPEEDSAGSTIFLNILFTSLGFINVFFGSYGQKSS